MLEPITHVSVAQETYERLRKAIFHGEFVQGQRLDPGQLAAAFGVSKQPVKEALNRLHVEGLVEIRPRVGTFVRVIGPDEAKQVLEVRLMMELFAIERLAVLPPVIEERLVQCVEGMRRVLAQRPFDWISYNDYDMGFHAGLVEASGNAVLYQHYVNLHSHYVTGRYWVGQEAKARRDDPAHEAVLEALRRCDREGAARILRAHIESAIATVEDSRRTAGARTKRV